MRWVHLVNDATQEGDWLYANRRWSLFGAEASLQHVCTTVFVEQRPVKVWVGFDQKSGPIPLQFE